MSRLTPETDAVRAYEGNWDTKALRMTAHARKLERERDEARDLVCAWENRWKAEVEFAAKVSAKSDELREELEILRSNKMSDPLLETTFKHLIRERDEAIIKYTGEANGLERQRNHAIAKCEDARRDLADAREALMKIEEIFIDGGDTYLDFVRVGNIATDYLEGL